ncbi:tripartite tricarboxylate transporter substrate binding protein [Piscinibacter koreensis]|uniref:Tripartite tricarboxylate transporter substrate binding protein n=1 Tax=Piscinibacter koreensis TaxID=2742824 RepID=A0A7Y6TYH3_9BURK|nr:tripartite tricarboxylate transporter substrate binding protein [Schlegelella koreensis]NUZ08091.1 tripartite tricarboxylate transporter substrate binding protein [Schlegelella koreensis]
MQLSLRISRGAILGLLAIWSATVFAQGYPDKIIKLVVPFPAAGGTDIVARTLAGSLTESLGQTVIVENRAGGNTVVGTQYVASAAADGYTLLFTSSSHTANPSLMKTLPYDTLKDFQPVCMAAFHPFVMLADPNAPFKTVRELITYAKTNPGKLNYASPGIGTSQHVAMEEFKRLAGIDMTHIIYKGSQDMATDLVTGRVSVMFNGISPTLSFVRSGKMRALAVDSMKRVALMPDVPTVDEAGVPGFTNTTWSGLLAPARTPKPVVDRLNAACNTALQSSDVTGRLTSMGLQPAGGPSAKFQEFLVQDMNRWAQLVKQSGAKIE